MPSMKKCHLHVTLTKSKHIFIEKPFDKELICNTSIPWVIKLPHTTHYLSSLMVLLNFVKNISNHANCVLVHQLLDVLFNFQFSFKTNDDAYQHGFCVA
jgi:hypothetical protein